MKFDEINQSEYAFDECYNKIHKTNLPIQIKNTILQMIEYDHEDRIGSYALYQSLLSISEVLQDNY